MSKAMNLAVSGIKKPVSSYCNFSQLMLLIIKGDYQLVVIRDDSNCRGLFSRLA